MDYIAEHNVVGAILRSPEIVPDVLAVVDVADFADPTSLNRRLFEAARALFREGSPIDPVLILGKLGLDGNKEARAYTAELMEITPTAANWREYADLMHEEAVLRKVHEQAFALQNALTLDACREPMAALSAAVNAGHGIRSRTLSELLNDFADRMAPDKPQKERFLTGLSPIDNRVLLTKGKVLMIGGLPSDGKTALALVWALKFAEKYNVGFFSLETDGETLTDRLVASGFQIDFESIVQQHLTDLDWVQFAREIPKFENRRLRIVEESRLTADQIAAISTAYGFDCIFIDYVQMIETEKVRGTTRAEQLADVSRTLHVFAQSTKTLVVELAQRKTPDKKEGQSNTDMFDLGESSQFGKDADIILQLARPGKDDRISDGDEGSKQMDFDKTRLLKIAKNKEGTRGKVKLYFDGNRQSFYILGTEPEARRPSDRKKKEKGNPGQQTITELPPEAEEGMPF